LDDCESVEEDTLEFGYLQYHVPGWQWQTPEALQAMTGCTNMYCQFFLSLWANNLLCIRNTTCSVIKEFLQYIDQLLLQ
jgi:hypothetical protein